MSFPQIILVLMLVTILGQSLMNLIIIFTLTGWGSLYRLTRAQMLSLREEEYVQALRAFGLNTFTICFKHILPNALGPIMVNITLSTAMFILQEAGLSFLGLGVHPNLGKYPQCRPRPTNSTELLVGMASFRHDYFPVCIGYQLCGRRPA